MEKLKVLDLFAGIGGFSLGLEQTELFQTEAFCENDKDCQKILKKHWPSIPIFEDIRKLKFRKKFCYYPVSDIPIKNIFKHDGIDVICGGFPCTDISFAGARKGIIKGERSSLWKEYWRLINEIRPKYAIIENVEYLRKNGLGIVLNDLARIGYDAEWSCVTADSVGYPHQRKRLFIISYPSGQRFNECSGKKRPIYVDEKWSNTALDTKGKQCQFESFEIRPILSRGIFEHIRNTSTYQRTVVSRIRRVTNGIPEGMDESRRKARIKQLGNAIVPEIARIIGEAIALDHYK